MGVGEVEEEEGLDEREGGGHDDEGKEEDPWIRVV